jgi:hypothetical protein
VNKKPLDEFLHVFVGYLLIDETVSLDGNLAGQQMFAQN